MTELGFEQVAATGLATLLIALVKGAFGGGFGLVGIPILSLVMDPISAGAVIAPLFIPMDLVSLRYFPPRTWSTPDVNILIPTMIVGIAIGTVVLSLLDTRLVSIAIGVVALAFAANWYAGGQKIVASPRKNWQAAVAGIVSGITTMVAHSGGPPLSVYLLRLGLAKEVFVGTTTIFFLVSNAIKVWPWLYLGKPNAAMWTLIAICTPVAMLGVWLGWLVHKRLDQRMMYQGCYLLLVITSCKMLWDGLVGHH
jgi:uncharacterized membrane protein YfcA